MESNEHKALKYFFLEYEIRSSWWASHVSWNWLQELSGKYFAWKVEKKYKRYYSSKLKQKLLDELILSQKDMEILFNELQNPSKPNDALKKAAEEYYNQTYGGNE